MPARNDLLEKIQTQSSAFSFFVQAKTNAMRDQITSVTIENSSFLLKIQTTKVPENNKANKQIIQIIADFLKLPKSNISIASGQSSKRKKVLIQFS